MESANDPATDFPLQNLPFGIFAIEGDARVGIAIGDRVLDLRAARRPTASAAAPAEDVPEEIEASLPDGYALTPALRASLKALPGIVDVHEL